MGVVLPDTIKEPKPGPEVETARAKEDFLEGAGWGRGGSSREKDKGTLARTHAQTHPHKHKHTRTDARTWM